MDQTNNIASSPSATLSPRTSKLAIAAFVLGILCVIGSIFWPILVVPGVVCMIFVSLKFSCHGPVGGGRINRRFFNLIIVVILLTILLPITYRARAAFLQMICRTNMVCGIQNGFIYYDDDDNRYYPPADRWCDALIENCDVGVNAFLCPGSDAVEGECAYAVNRHIYDCDPNQIPADMVFLFETDAGKDPGPRTESIRSREFFQSLSRRSDRVSLPSADIKVYPKRWNQVGGPEDAAFRHRGKCIVLLWSGDCVNASLDEIHKLCWTVEVKK